MCYPFIIKYKLLSRLTTHMEIIGFYVTELREVTK